MGGTSLDFQMELFTYKSKSNGMYTVKLLKTWVKLLLLACAIVAIENLTTVTCHTFQGYSQQAVLKFVATTGAAPIAGCSGP